MLAQGTLAKNLGMCTYWKQVHFGVLRGTLRLNVRLVGDYVSMVAMSFSIIRYDNSGQSPQ